jgi:hypothetical protein
MADSTLNAIRIKIRRLTRKPNTSDISNAQIDEYINTFVQYDFPEHLRLFIKHIPISFYLVPNKSTYGLTEIGPLTKFLQTADFKNDIITINGPVYVNGRNVVLSQSQKQFYSIYPKNRLTAQIGTGNGILTTFNATLNTNVVPGSINVSSIDTANQAINVFDVPSTPFTGSGTLATPQLNAPSGTINYVTGALSVTWPATVPGVQQAVWVSYQSAAVGVPQTMLYFGTELTFRPIPDKGYECEFEVYQRPTQLLLAGDTPELEQWWQYIAYGAAKKIFEDLMDMESVQMILPEFQKQENLVNRRTIVQNTNDRVATIYTDQAQYYGSNSFDGI